MSSKFQLCSINNERNSYGDIDGLLVGITSIYLACKIEESPQHIKIILNESQQVLGGN